MNPRAELAPPLQVQRWFNNTGGAPVTLDGLRGRVVLLHAFQMLCPGCVSLAVPQMARIGEAFSPDDVAIVGVHTVFEHHAAMAPEALEVFLHEYRIEHPVGVDTPSPRGPVPLTMQAYGWRGTPSLALIDRAGRLRLNHFGHLDDLRLGALIGQLLAEGEGVTVTPAAPEAQAGGDCRSTLQCERRERSA